MSKFKKLLCKMVVIVMLVNLWSGVIINTDITYAATTFDGLGITKIDFTIDHNEFNKNYGNLSVQGTDLTGINLQIRKVGGDIVSMLPSGIVSGGATSINAVHYQMTAEDVSNFSGEVIINGQSVDIGAASIPTINSSTKKKINQDFYTDPGASADDKRIIFNGSNLDQIWTGAGDTANKFLAYYGRGISKNPIYFKGSSTPTKLYLEQPMVTDNFGNQTIIFEKSTSQTVSATTFDCDLSLTYQSVFSIVRKVNVSDLSVYPTAGAKGDEIVITGTDFTASNHYGVYFLKNLNGSDAYTLENRAEFISLGIDVNGTIVDQLTVKIPDGKNFEKRDYSVVLTIDNNEGDINRNIIAEQIIRDGAGDPIKFTVIEATYKPIINLVTPSKGPSVGSNVQIQGENIIQLNLPDLNYDSVAAGATSGVDISLNPAHDRILVDYDYYNDKAGDPVTVHREISAQIGNFLSFTNRNERIDAPLSHNIIYAETPVITDVVSDPTKDVIVQIDTTVTFRDGTVKNLVQVARLTDGYTYYPSTYIPTINSVTSDVLQVTHDRKVGGDDVFQLAKDTLISIDGADFFVTRNVTPTGDVEVKYPNVLIKKSTSNINEETFQIGFFPNEEEAYVDAAGVNRTMRGIIKYKSVENSATAPIILTDPDTNEPLTFEMVIIDDAGRVIDGTENLKLGSRIVLRMPKASAFPDIDYKSIQVINPVKDDPDMGGTSGLDDAIRLVQTPDAPVIDTLEPNIVTVDGNEKITITGSNFQDNIKVYLDGIEIKSITRDIDIAGAKIILTFNVPPGREGETQVMVQNPNGGMDVRAFNYVKSFNKDPIITNFSPPQGEPDTLVVINGDNYIKPDPTAVKETGFDAFRLLGTRVILDGKEVNEYSKDASGDIAFEDYTRPSEEAIIINNLGTAQFSRYIENAYIEANGRPVTLGFSKEGAPEFITESDAYYIRYEGSGYKAYSKKEMEADATYKGVSVNVQYNAGSHQTKIAVPGGPTFTGYMNNQIFSTIIDSDGDKKVNLANYGESVILKKGDIHFIIYNELDGHVVLTNGRNERYNIVLEGTNYKAEDINGNRLDIVPTDTGLELDGEVLTMVTAYHQTADGYIDGHKGKVLAKNQMIFSVPVLNTGNGYKDLTIINPDTKSFTMEGNNGFYYVNMASSKPVISTISPSKGSIDGGYYVKITGNDFDYDTSLYVDSVKVPENDMYVNIDKTEIVFKMPPTIKNLKAFDISYIDVPIVIVNRDGGSAYRRQGFTYVVPDGSPRVDAVIKNTGSSSGGEIVEIIGGSFKFYEPYKNEVGTKAYEVGDPYEDLNHNGKWDEINLFEIEQGIIDPGLITEIPVTNHPIIDHYYESPILPRVYFGEQEARIVDFADGHMKVIAPVHKEGQVEVYVINNDSGISNKNPYTYKASNPSIREINPNEGNRTGLEVKDIYGNEFYQSRVNGYTNDDDTTIVKLNSDTITSGNGVVEALVRFGNITNENIPRGEENSGLIYSQRTTVNVEGGLKVEYNGRINELTLSLLENRKLYTRKFSTYDDSEVYIPLDMLMYGTDYYVPFEMKDVDEKKYSHNIYEYVKVSIVDRRLIVERGYAPNVRYNNLNHVEVLSPSYYSIGNMPVNYINPDGGVAQTNYTYANPATEPKIHSILPQKIDIEETSWNVEAALQGKMEIEILGKDFKEGVRVQIGPYDAEVKEITKKEKDGEIFDVVVVTVPPGNVSDIDMKYPVILINEDSGIANSSDLDDILGPNYNLTGSKPPVTLPYYFVYKKPLSGPKITEVTPPKTSVYGGNKVSVVGTDFREGAYVVIGTTAGIPITTAVRNEEGTLMTFDTPKELGLGKKNIQVINEDYGIAIAENALEIVSYPQIDDDIRLEDGSPITWLSVEGDEKIILKGSDFHENASVYFGGEWVRDSKYPAEQGFKGWYKDDTEYKIIGDAKKAPDVKFIDEETLVVTTPKMDYEGELPIVVINEDTGISDPQYVTYTVPIPRDPIGLKVELINNQYIKIYNYNIEDADYYEIYAYLGHKSEGQLSGNQMKDFEYLGITDQEPYKITYLPGVENLEKGERIYFVVKAVNKFGPSSWSNMTYLTEKDMEDVKELGPEDIDKGIGVADGETHEVTINGPKATVNLSEKEVPESLFVDLSKDDLSRVDEKTLNIPSSIIESKPISNIVVHFKDVLLTVKPMAFNTDDYKRIAFYEKAYGQILVDMKRDQETSSLLAKIPRSMRNVSEVYQVDFNVTTNTNKVKLDHLISPVDVKFFYSPYLTQAQEAQVGLFKYNESSRRWERVNGKHDPKDNSISIRIYEPGAYMIMTNR